MNRQWNTVATVCVLVTVAYIAICGSAFLMGRVEFREFSAAVVPVVTAWGGYMAALLPKAGA